MDAFQFGGGPCTLLKALVRGRIWSATCPVFDIPETGTGSIEGQARAEINPCERALVLSRHPTHNYDVWSRHLAMEVRSWFQASGEVLYDT